eukprot:gene4098-14198_t
MRFVNPWSATTDRLRSSNPRWRRRLRLQRPCDET